jgi:putative hydrolase of the HAD superfamily
MSEPVAAVLSDLADTLCRYRRDPGTVLSAAFERAGVEPSFPAEAYYDRFDEFADGAADMDELRERCFAALARERGHDPELGRAVAEAYGAERADDRRAAGRALPAGATGWGR